MKTETRSFKTKLWFYFALFTAFIFIVLWLLQTVFLQGFYDRMLISDTKKAAETIIEGALKPDIEKRIDNIARKNSLVILIANEEGDIIYSSDEFKGMHTKTPPEAVEKSSSGKPSAGSADKEGSSNPPPPKPDDETEKKEYRSLPNDFEDIVELLGEGGSASAEKITDDYYTFGAYIDYFRQDGKVILYIGTPFNAAGTSVIILKKILAIVTVLSLIAGFVLSWFIARKFSKPVGLLSKKAEKLGESDQLPEYERGFCRELDLLSDTLDRTNEKLLASKDFQMQLLSNVSHDLRTPLTMIKGYAEMIRDISWEDGERIKEDIQVVIKETDRLNALVNEILEYSELQTETGETGFEDLDLSELVKNSVERFEKLSSPDNVVIDRSIETGIRINGNPGLIERALYNLMDNAVRHTGNGKKIRVSVSKTCGRALIEVQDYGEGIPKDQLDHIWERYYTYRQRGGKGVSGLGLAIVKQIAGIHNGSCRAESEEGKGSGFFLEIPALSVDSE